METTNQINELVEKAAAQNKDQNNQGNSGENSNNNNQGDNGAGGGAGQSQEEIDKAATAETERLAGIQKLKDEARAEFLAEIGVDSVDALKDKLKETGKGELTPEQKEKAEQLYESNLRTFAVDKDLMKLEDFDQLHTLRSKEDAVLVFDKYLEDWKEENPEMVVGENDITEADIVAAAKKDFEKEFKLNHSNEKVKGKGIAKLASEAAAIRNPLLSSYNSAKEAYDTDTELRTNYPKFADSVQKVATELVPKTFEWHKGKDGEEDVNVEIEIPDDDRKEIFDKVVKRLSTPDSYQLFKEGKLDELKERVTDYVDYLVTKKSKEIGNAKIAEIFLGRGIAKGSTTGANNSFATNQSTTGAQSTDTKSKTEVEKGILEQFGNKK